MWNVMLVHQFLQKAIIGTQFAIYKFFLDPPNPSDSAHIYAQFKIDY